MDASIPRTYQASLSSHRALDIARHRRSSLGLFEIGYDLVVLKVRFFHENLLHASLRENCTFDPYGF